MKRYFFDLDGTLFDTESLVRQAYALAGVEMPADAWGKPAREWLPEISGDHWKWVHEKKQVYYEKLMRQTPPVRTTACRAMIELQLRGVQTYVVTGASRKAAQGLLKTLQTYHYRLLATDCTRDHKMDVMKKIGLDNAVYVDDDVQMCHRAKDAGAEIVWYRFTMTKEEVLAPWERSSLRPDAVND